jgi:hypothetical protein
VQYQSCVATPALDGLATGRAEQRRGEPAAVQVEQRLSAGPEVAAKRLDERPGEAVRRRVPPQVHHVHGRVPRSTRPFGQVQVQVAARLRVRQALQRRGRGDEHHRDAEVVGAPDREVAGRVAETLLLLE